MKKEWQVGDRIAGKWLVEKIFKGGMGAVYIVYDEQSKEAYAAKTFRPELWEENPQIIDQFTRESLAWIKLDLHPHIAQANRVEMIEGKPVLFLEYVTGGDLAAWIGTARLTSDFIQVLNFGIQFCDGMIHAFSKGIKAHRDIKPANCLVTADQKLKITDFGLAKIFDNSKPAGSNSASSGFLGRLFGEKEKSFSDDLSLSRTGNAAGTCTHMSPEQFDDTKHVDVRADVYSFGIMLFQMIEGRLPFSGRSWSEFERLHKTQPPPTLKNPDPDLNRVLQTCLAKDPSNRFADFSELRKQLENLYEKETGRGPPSRIEGAALDSFQWSNKGSSLANLGKLEAALSCYHQALQIHPRYETALIGKGAVLEAMGKLQESLACYEDALEIDPRHPVGWTNKGNIFSKLGDYEKAIQCYDRAILVKHLHQTALVNKSAALLKSGKPNDALFCIERALEVNSRDADAWSNQGTILGLIGKNELSLSSFNQALELNPLLGSAWLGKGLLLFALKKEAEALPNFEQAVHVNSKDQNAWLHLGKTYAVLNKMDQALPCFQEAGKLGHPEASHYIALCQKYLTETKETPKSGGMDDEQRIYEKALAHHQAGQLVQEIGCYDLILEKNPRHEKAWHNKGVALSMMMQIDEAWSCFELAHQLGHPQSAKAMELCRKYVEEKEAADLTKEKADPFETKGPQSKDAPDLKQKLSQGILFMVDKRWNEALASFEDLLKIYPKEAAIWGNRGTALAGLGRLQEALESHDKALNIDPRHPVPLFSKSILLINMNRSKDALPFLNRLLEVEPDNHIAWYNKGAVLMNDFQLFEAASACFMKAHSLGNPGAAQALAQCEAIIKKSPVPQAKQVSPGERQKILDHVISAAATEFGLPKDKFHSATDLPRDIGCDELDIAEFLMQIEHDFDIFDKNPNRHAGIKTIDDVVNFVIQRRSPSPSTRPPISADNEKKINDLFQKGADALNAQRYEEAITLFEQVLALDPSYPQAWFNKGLAQDYWEKFEEALLSYNKATELKPDYERAWDSKGFVLRQLGRIEESVACYDRVLALNPKNVDVWYRKGWALNNKLNRKEEALACYNRLLELDPKHENAWMEKGAVLSALGRYEDEVTACNHLLEINPTHVATWIYKGNALAKLGRVEEELKCYDVALKLDPNRFDAWQSKGMAIRQQERYEEALTCFDKGLAINPNDSQGWYRRGWVLRNKLNQPEEAIGCYNRVLELNPKNEDAWLEKALALGKLNRADEELTCYTRLLEINPQSADGWLYKGWWFQTRSRWKEALDSYELAQKYGSKDVARKIEECRQKL